MRIAIVDDLSGERALLREQLARQLARRGAAAGVLAYKGCAPAGAAAVHAPQATPRFAKAERCRPFLQCRKVLFALLTTVFYLRNTGGSRVRAGDYASTVPPRTQNTPSTVGLQRTPRETHSSITCPTSRNR